MKKFLPFLFFILSGPCFGQELLTISDGRAERTTRSVSTVRVFSLNDELSKIVTDGKESEPEVTTVKLVEVNTKSNDFLISIEDKDRNDCRSKFTKLKDRFFVSSTKGEYWFRVVDFEARKEQTVRVLVDVSPAPKPEPEPEPKPPTPEPPKPDVKNEYGVGKIALELCPDDPINAKKFADEYRKHADMLFGRPKLATINEVLTSLKKVVDSRFCTNQAECVKWSNWQLNISQAIASEQRKRGFLTGQQWYGLLLEVAEALEAK